MLDDIDLQAEREGNATDLMRVYEIRKPNKVKQTRQTAVVKKRIIKPKVVKIKQVKRQIPVFSLSV